MNDKFEMKPLLLSIINGNKTIINDEKNPSNLNWGDLGVNVVLECSGTMLTKEKANKHIEAGAEKVILSAPPKDETPIYVFGVNHLSYTNSQKIISNASCTTNCLAPLAKVLNDNFGIEEGLMTTVHAATISQLTVDGISKGGKDWRAGRATGPNIIPASTGAAKAVGRVIPELKGKITGMAFRVPTTNVSCVDLTVKLKSSTDYKSICEKMFEMSEGSMRGILGFTDEEVVSMDFNGDSHSSIFDKNAGIALNPNFYKFIAWYDNEWGYSNRMIDMAQFINKHN